MQFSWGPCVSYQMFLVNGFCLNFFPCAYKLFGSFPKTIPQAKGYSMEDLYNKTLPMILLPILQSRVAFEGGYEKPKIFWKLFCRTIKQHFYAKEMLSKLLVTEIWPQTRLPWNEGCTEWLSMHCTQNTKYEIDAGCGHSINPFLH